MGKHNAVPARARFVELVERMLAPTQDERAWASDITDVARSLFPNAALVNFQIIEFDADDGARACRLAVPEQPTRALLEMAIRARTPLCPAGVVQLKIAHDASEDTAPKLGNIVTLVAHPLPGIVTALGALFDHEPVLGRRDRSLLARLAMHLDAAHRLRLRPHAVEAVISATGRVLFKGPREIDESALRAGVTEVARARSPAYRGHPDGIDLWAALQHGRVSVVPRTVGTKVEYVILDNPPQAYALRALSGEEAATLRLACQGISNKLIGYGLGLSPASISRHLASAASKVGLASRAELVRIAALLVRDERAEMSDAVLSVAERDILALLRRGLSNQEIAGLRLRSVRTVANQVAALLRKTQSASRRELLVRPLRADMGQADATH